MIETTKQTTVPEKNEQFKGSVFKRWDAFVAKFFQEHPEYKAKDTANNKQKRKRNNDR